MLQRNDIQEQLHNIETKVEDNERTLENWSNTELVFHNFSDDHSLLAYFFFINVVFRRAKPISDRIINQKNYQITKRNQLEFVQTCIAFLEFTQQQQQALGRKQVSLRIGKVSQNL